MRKQTRLLLLEFFSFFLKELAFKSNHTDKILLKQPKVSGQNQTKHNIVFISIYLIQIPFQVDFFSVANYSCTVWCIALHRIALYEYFKWIFSIVYLDFVDPILFVRCIIFRCRIGKNWNFHIFALTQVENGRYYVRFVHRMTNAKVKMSKQQDSNFSIKSSDFFFRTMISILQ